ncbi:MAG TPA: HEAT repeat domain-containing protein [Candidatus Aquilonibacter sp.]|nr:HEAT repeat domain-containing protein [Candidatus Aquilonibacter sp.]
MRFPIKSVGAVALICFFLGFCLQAQAQKNLSKLLDELQKPETSGQAAQQLRTLAKSRLPVRRYLASHLGSIIDATPPSGPIPPVPWVNAVELAVEFKVAEATPALAKQIQYNTNAGSLSEPGIAGYPAAEALAKIGDASIPALQKLLQTGTELERTNAVYVLLTIDSARAVAILRQTASENSDPGGWPGAPRNRSVSCL